MRGYFLPMTSIQALPKKGSLLSPKETCLTEIDGRSWAQPSFSYQLKCLCWTRDEFAALSAADQSSVRAIPEETGLSPLIDAEIDDG